MDFVLIHKPRCHTDSAGAGSDAVSQIVLIDAAHREKPQMGQGNGNRMEIGRLHLTVGEQFDEIRTGSVSQSAFRRSQRTGNGDKPQFTGTADHIGIGVG